VHSKFWTHLKIKDLLWLFFRVIRRYVTIIFFPPLCGRCLKKQNAPLAGILFFERVSWDKRKESLKCIFFDLMIYSYHAHTHMWLHFNLQLIPCKMCQYSFCLVPGLQVLLVGCWELGDNVKYYWWVVESLVTMSSMQWGWSSSTLRTFLVYLDGSS
jgi:hypothetical protein